MTRATGGNQQQGCALKGTTSAAGGDGGKQRRSRSQRQHAQQLFCAVGRDPAPCNGGRDGDDQDLRQLRIDRSDSPGQSPHTGLQDRPRQSAAPPSPGEPAAGGVLAEKSCGRAEADAFSPGRRRKRTNIPIADASRKTANAGPAGVPGIGSPVSYSKPVQRCHSRRRNAAAPSSTGNRKNIHCFFIF